MRLNQYAADLVEAEIKKLDILTGLVWRDGGVGLHYMQNCIA